MVVFLLLVGEVVVFLLLVGEVVVLSAGVSVVVVVGFGGTDGVDDTTDGGNDN